MTQTIINVPAAGAFDPSDITLTDDTSGALLIKEGSNEYMRIDTTNGSEQMILKGRPGLTAGLFLNYDPYLQGNVNQSIQMTGNGVQTTVINSGTRIVNKLNASTYFQVSDSANAALFKVEEDSNATFTLDGASAATFKVVDDNASPKTYLSITESTQSYAADPYVHKVTLGDNNGYFNLGPNALRANAMQGGSTALYGPASYLYGQSAVGVTTNQTYNNFDPCQTPYTITMESGATGNVTIDSGFTVRGDYQTGAAARQSFPVLWVFQNDNATHNFILSFDGGTSGLEHTKSGDTDAAALISAGGLTLTPGQRYIVRFQKITGELLLIESVDKH